MNSVLRVKNFKPNEMKIRTSVQAVMLLGMGWGGVGWNGMRWGGMGCGE